MAGELSQNVESLDTAVDPNFDYMYKTLIVGNSGVGKTAFLVRYCDDAFSPSFVSTVGIDFKVKTLFRCTTIRDLSWENARIVMVGNKLDLADSRVISKENAEDLAQSLGIKYIETSAKEDINVKLTFETLVDEISEKMAETMETNPNFVPQGVRPRKEDDKPVSSGCSC